MNTHLTTLRWNESNRLLWQIVTLKLSASIVVIFFYIENKNYLDRCSRHWRKISKKGKLISIYSTIKKTEKRYCQYEKNVSNKSLKDENYIM